MKNSKERKTSKVVTVESGVCEKIQSIEGLKNIEIAEQLGVSDSTVKKAKAKALEILREKLDPRLFLFFFLG